MFLATVRWIDRLLLLGGGVGFGVVLAGCLLLILFMWAGRRPGRR